MPLRMPCYHAERPMRQTVRIGMRVQTDIGTPAQRALAGARSITGVLLAIALLASDNAIATRHPSQASQHALVNPSAETIAQVDRLLPGVLSLILATEANALAQGRSLRADEIALARRVGVSAPERVRVLEEAYQSGTGEPLLAGLIRRLGASNPRMWGLTTRYGIVFKTHPTRPLLAHELRHVAQYEQLGVDGFARRYITELLVVGYALAPLETDANAAAAPYQYKGLP